MKNTKFNKLSPGLRKHIITRDGGGAGKSGKGTLSEYVSKSKTPVSAFAERTLNHCNGGATYQAAVWLKNHLDNGGKLVVTIAGALSSFQVGVTFGRFRVAGPCVRRRNRVDGDLDGIEKGRTA